MDVQPTFHAQRGISLIEVMIAFFVLSVGLLGVAGLQLTSLRDNNSALLRSRAIVLGSDILERMRSNPDGISNYAVTWAGDGVSHACQQVHGTAASACAAKDLAEDDVWMWKRMISDVDNSGTEPPYGLPGGKGQVTIAASGITGLSTVTVSLEWQEGDDSPSFTTVTQL